MLRKWNYLRFGNWKIVEIEAQPLIAGFLDQ